MSEAPDYHDYSTLSEYMEAVKSAGYSFPALLGWVVQSTMERRGCTFQAGMDYQVRTGGILLNGGSSLLEGKRDTKTINVTQRLKDLDAYNEEGIDRENGKGTEEEEHQKGDGEREKP